MKHLSLVVLAAMASGVLHAHHGITTQFDLSKVIQVEGTITEVAWVNPHAYVYLDVADANGNTVTWNCEMRAASVLSRSGWSEDMFAPGTSIKIAGAASRRDPVGCYVEEFALGAGPVIERYEQIETDRGDFQQNRPETTAWGDPNIDGHWAAPQRIVGAVTAASLSGGGASGPQQTLIQRADPNQIPPGLTPAGESAYVLYMLGQQGLPTGALSCAPRDILTDWTFDQHSNRIVQEQDKITLTYGFMDTVRTIHMNMTEHPADITPSWTGHSIGRWEGDTLVVDTRGFTPAGILWAVSVTGVRSTEYHMVERFRVDHQNRSLVRSYTTSDPLFAVGEQTGEQTVFLADYPYEPYNCDDRAVVD